MKKKLTYEEVKALVALGQSIGLGANTIDVLLNLIIRLLPTYKRKVLKQTIWQ